MQLRGFNGFSYADVAVELHVTKASLHYHFAGKADLGESLIRRYDDRFARALAEIDGRRGGAPAKLDAYAALYGRALEGERMCLCGMLAAEYQTLPEAMRRAVVEFFDRNEAWLADVLREGKRSGSLDYPGSARDVARTIISTLEGALLVSRPYGDEAHFHAASRRLLQSLRRAPGR